MNKNNWEWNFSLYSLLYSSTNASGQLRPCENFCGGWSKSLHRWSFMAIIAAHKRVEIYLHLENQSKLILTCFMGLQKNVSKFAFPSIYFAA